MAGEDVVCEENYLDIEERVAGEKKVLEVIDEI